MMSMLAGSSVEGLCKRAPGTGAPVEAMTSGASLGAHMESFGFSAVPSLNNKDPAAALQAAGVSSSIIQCGMNCDILSVPDSLLAAVHRCQSTISEATASMHMARLMALETSMPLAYSYQPVVGRRLRLHQKRCSQIRGSRRRRARRRLGLPRNSGDTGALLVQNSELKPRLS